MRSGSITDPLPSPKLNYEPSFSEMPEVRLLKHNSGKMQADLLGSKPEADEPFFNKVGLSVSQSFSRMDSIPSYTKEMTPRGGNELQFFEGAFNGDASPSSAKFVDLEKPEKFLIEPSPKAKPVPPPTPRDRPTQIIAAEVSHPTTNLRKRKPSGLDKIEIPPPKLRPSKQIAVRIEDEESEEMAELELELTPEKQSMLNLLVKILKHDNITAADLEGFAPVDLEVVRSIVKRKYGLNIKDVEDRKKLANELNTLDNRQKGQKRSEENNKLVFKRAVKNLISTYKSTHHQEMKDMKKKEYETIIVRHYFGGLPLPEVKKRKTADNDDEKKISEKPPTTQRMPSGPKGDEKLRRFVINPNTINAKYIRFVFKSAAFKQFFDDFVTNHFIADYRRHRPNKIRKIIDAVYANFNTKKPRQFQIQNAKDYIEKNPKFKLPWSDKELETCITSTREFIARVFRVRDDRKKRR